VKNKSESRKYVWLVALSLCSTQGAQACEVWRDEVLKVWRGNCNLTLDPKAPKVFERFVGQSRWADVFKMPDLVIDKFKFYLVGNSLEVSADVANIGRQNSAATNVGITVTTIDVSNPTSPTTTPLLANVPSLAPAATLRISLGTVFVNYSAHDVDVVTAGMVDQVTVAQPVRGTVVESNETNNSLMHTCRVYGPIPDVSVRACN
jgi:hypothetical protein